VVIETVPDGGPLQRDKLKEIWQADLHGPRKGKVPMAPPIALRFTMPRAVQSMPMRLGLYPMIDAGGVFVMFV